MWLSLIDTATKTSHNITNYFVKQECIPVGCVPPAFCPYLPACTAPGGVPAQVLPPRGQNSWHTLLKILPCPKLRLRAVINFHVICQHNINKTHTHRLTNLYLGLHIVKRREQKCWKKNEGRLTLRNKPDKEVLSEKRLVQTRRKQSKSLQRISLEILCKWWKQYTYRF